MDTKDELVENFQDHGRKGSQQSPHDSRWRDPKKPHYNIDSAADQEVSQRDQHGCERSWLAYSTNDIHQHRQPSKIENREGCSQHESGGGPDPVRHEDRGSSAQSQDYGKATHSPQRLLVKIDGHLMLISYPCRGSASIVRFPTPRPES